jgi:hypothetical protein
MRSRENFGEGLFHGRLVNQGCIWTLRGSHDLKPSKAKEVVTSKVSHITYIMLCHVVYTTCQKYEICFTHVYVDNLLTVSMSSGPYKKAAILRYVYYVP